MLVTSFCLEYVSNDKALFNYWFKCFHLQRYLDNFMSWSVHKLVLLVYVLNIQCNVFKMFMEFDLWTFSCEIVRKCCVSENNSRKIVTSEKNNCFILLRSPFLTDCRTVIKCEFIFVKQTHRKWFFTFWFDIFGYPEKCLNLNQSRYFKNSVHLQKSVFQWCCTWICTNMLLGTHFIL